MVGHGGGVVPRRAACRRRDAAAVPGGGGRGRGRSAGAPRRAARALSRHLSAGVLVRAVRALRGLAPRAAVRARARARAHLARRPAAHTHHEEGGARLLDSRIEECEEVERAAPGTGDVPRIAHQHQDLRQGGCFRCGEGTPCTAGCPTTSPRPSGPITDCRCSGAPSSRN